MASLRQNPGQAPWIARRASAMKAVLAELADVPGLADALDTARRLPAPCYTDEAWSVVSALLDLLPRLAARLTVAFRDAGVLDFTQGMLGALDALGSDEWPSDLLLALDLRIDHLLIDEFRCVLRSSNSCGGLRPAGSKATDARCSPSGDRLVDLPLSRSRGTDLRRGPSQQDSRAPRRVPGARAELRSHAGLVAWSMPYFRRCLAPQRPLARRRCVRPATAGRVTPPGQATLEIVPDDATEPTVSSVTFAPRSRPA
jgi:hypothetical protein